MIFDHLNPVKVYRSLSECVEDLINFSKYKEIVRELYTNGKLEEIGLTIDQDANLYIGINLNPELLLYSETSQTSVELKMISEKMNKYNDFLTKEGILDYIKVEYDRAQDVNFYGYILQISYNFKKYRKKKMIYSLCYFASLLALLLTGVLLLAR
jgi:hypothetical protein